MAISLTLLGTFFVLLENDHTATLDKLQWIPMTSLMVYMVGFSIGYGPLAWALNGEFYAPEAKSLSSTVGMVFNWLCAFAVAKTQVNLENAIGASGSYFLYAGICLLSIPFVAFLVPETKGRSPEDMKELFEKKGKELMLKDA